jgi:hypothetical protein
VSFVVNRTEDRLSESSTEYFHNKFLTPEIITAITGRLSDSDSDVRRTAVDAIGEWMVHGELEGQVVQKISYLSLQ